ncbi:MAG: STT3 domain-containing protein [Candidatus Binatia bacterium]
MRRGTLGTAVILAATCVAGFLLRTTNAATVLLGGRVVLAENDPYYHMRRVLAALAEWPHVPSFDAWIDFPHGAPVVFAPLFDLGIATLALLAGLKPEQRSAIETLAAFVPPVLGALTSVATYALALRMTSRAAALLAALLVALTPAHAWYSRLGFVDHHVAVTLAMIVIAALFLRALGIDSTEAPSPRAAATVLPRRGATVAAALALACGLLLWNGTLLLVAVLDAALAVLFVAGDAARRRSVGTLVCATHLAAAVILLAVVPGIVRDTGWPWSAVTLSYLHAGLLAAAGLLGGLAALLGARGASGATLLAVAGVTAIAGAGALVVQHDALVRVHEWLFAADPFMGAVQESVSIVRTSDGRFDLVEARVWMGRFFLATPLLLAFLGARIVRGANADPGRLFLLVWTALLFLATLAQRRFAETAAPALAILVADFLTALADAARAWLAERGVARAPVRLLVASMTALLVGLAFAPYYTGFFADADRLTAVLRAPVRPHARDAYGERDREEQEGSLEVRLDRTFRRLAQLEASRAAAEGAPGAAMAAWPLGHKLMYTAGTPVAATPFGSYVGGNGFADSTDFLLGADDAAGRTILERRRSRWVVVDDDLGTIGAAIVGRGENPRDWYGKEVLPDGGVSYPVRAPLARSTYFRLTKLAGSAARVSLPGGDTVDIPAVPGLRLVIDAPRDDGQGFAKVYEVVRGARAVVNAPPGAVVRARYAYTSDAGRERTYETSSVADVSGRAVLELPYSSERPDLGQTSAWRVTSGDRARDVRVTEDDVRTGRERAVDLN